MIPSFWCFLAAHITAAAGSLAALHLSRPWKASSAHSGAFVLSWECRQAVHIQGLAPSEAKGRKKDTSKKAVLISGTPGIGKSSSALIICRCVQAPRMDCAGHTQQGTQQV